MINLKIIMNVYSILYKAELPNSEFIELKIFNILGKEVKSLVSKQLNSETTPTQLKNRS